MSAFDNCFWLPSRRAISKAPLSTLTLAMRSPASSTSTPEDKGSHPLLSTNSGNCPLDASFSIGKIRFLGTAVSRPSGSPRSLTGVVGGVAHRGLPPMPGSGRRDLAHSSSTLGRTSSDPWIVHSGLLAASYLPISGQGLHTESHEARGSHASPSPMTRPVPSGLNHRGLQIGTGWPMWQPLS